MPLIEGDRAAVMTVGSPSSSNQSTFWSPAHIIRQYLRPTVLPAHIKERITLKKRPKNEQPSMTATSYNSLGMDFMKAVTKKINSGIFTAVYSYIRARKKLYNSGFMIREKYGTMIILPKGTNEVLEEADLLVKSRSSDGVLLDSDACFHQYPGGRTSRGYYPKIGKHELQIVSFTSFTLVQIASNSFLHINLLFFLTTPFGRLY